MPTSIDIRKLQLQFTKGKTKLHISTPLAQGVTILLGPNGVGKTTLINHIIQSAVHSTGAIMVNHQNQNTKIPVHLQTKHLGIMPQSSEFYPGFTVRDTVEYQAWLNGAKRRNGADAAANSLRDVRIEHLANRKANRLSGGEKRSVSFAEWVVSSPKFLLLDEPTVGLDPTQRREMRKLIKMYGQKSVVLMTTDLLDDVSNVADHVIVLSRQGIVFSGSPQSLADRSPNSASSYEERLNDGYEVVLG